jgi:endonuclease/exonuclease/phosphatase family metal-dependent hydrolase
VRRTTGAIGSGAFCINRIRSWSSAKSSTVTQSIRGLIPPQGVGRCEDEAFRVATTTLLRALCRSPLGGRAFRFVTTHLETSAPINVAQAAELVQAVGTPLPAVVVGDFNAATGDPAYAALVNDVTALHDAWVDLGAPAGPTCCHDAAVSDPAALPGRRVDLVLHRGGFVPRGASVVGADPASMRDGLWPSDHAGVVATLELR